MKLTKQDIDKVRDIEGFPLGSDEDIIALSNPPYYTACPNPFIKDFIEKNGKPYNEETDDYKREPFAADVSEGKNDTIYNAHSYHTKVPYKAIMRYILNYTEPGDVIFDGFSGTGMTGVAAQMCGNPDYDLKMVLEKELDTVKWGTRKVILNDLSTIGAFISYNYNNTTNVEELYEEGSRIIQECERELGWMYETKHTETNNNFQIDLLGSSVGKINHIVWSDVLICPNCGKEIVFWNQAVDCSKKSINDIFECQNCKVELKKKDCEKAFKMFYDEDLKENITMAKQVPVLISYTVNGKRFEKLPDKDDIRNIEKIDSMKVKYWYPIDRMCEGKESRRNDKNGITHVHHFFTRRNNIILAYLYNEIMQSKYSKELLFAFTASNQRANKTNRFRFGGTGNLSGTLYIPSLVYERNVILLFANKFRDVIKQKRLVKSENAIVTTGSLTNMAIIPTSSIDYIFTDPPFGDNLNYSELSFLWEVWLKIKTNTLCEAIVNSSQDKGITEYHELMTECFKEYYRVLKPNRWITVEFHNSKNAVWNSIQEALQKSGFIVADVSTLDKKQGSFKQVTNSSSVKQDLVISAYKPKESFIREFSNHIGSEESVWDYIRNYLDNLKVVIKNGNKIEVSRERQAYLLFDKMIAYHVINGLPVPIDASKFYKGLDDKFIKRDNMYFLHDQINEYDSARIIADIEPVQFSLLVNNEKNAIAWLYQQLEIPQTYSELQPKFMRESVKDRYEKMPELRELLEENFIQDEYDKWYIPDVTKSGDIIKLREKRLAKEFEEYLQGKGKLKIFRTEAIRVGFAKLWKEKDYSNIIKVANRLPENVIQEDDKLLMYYDISLSRME